MKTLFPLTMERRETTIQLAQLEGRELEPHEGFNRSNSGGWIITDADGYGIIEVRFQGKAKRGKEYDAPDPDGQELARAIVESMNAKYSTK